MNTMESYRRAQEHFDAVLAAVPQNKWDAPSACSEWRVRDVAGHVIWGQVQLRHWATGQEYGNTEGAPGAPHPGVLAGGDPLVTWREARAAALATLDDETLGRKVALPGLGELPLTGVITILVTDHLAHTWDIGHALGLPVQLEPELVKDSFAWARDNVFRAPGFFGPEVTPAADADEQTRWLAFLGRAAGQSVAA